MFDTLIRHGFLTNQNARRVLSTLYLLIIYMICSFKEILQNTGTSIGTIAMATASLSTADLTTKVESCLSKKLTRQALLMVTFNIIRDFKKKFTHVTKKDSQSKKEKRKRKRKVIWFNPSYSLNVKTNT